MRTLLFLTCLATACTGGAGSQAAVDSVAARRDSLTKHQRDSVLGQSELPGARGVAGALSAQDSGAARQRVVDSIANEN